MRDIQTSGRFKRISTSSKSRDEIEQLGETFNEMIERLEDNYHKQEQFVSNASHELKTPLTVIESYASLLQRRGASRPEIIGESVEAIHSEAVRMRELTQQLLLLARQSEKENLHITEVDVEAVAADAVENYRSSYHREIELTGGPAIVQTDPDKVKQLLYILLDNARKYSSDVINVKIETTETGPGIAVIDRGIGIPEKDIERVFERFYRVDESRTRTSGGYGLGLSLAKDITEALGARITIESTYGQGTAVRLIFPVTSE
jgi:signal transduction histidine kinase